MTLDEAIKHAEEVAEEQEKLYRLCPASESEIFHCDGTKDCKTLENGKNKGCQKCAEEHRQLAEWLKDYKRLLEQEPCEDLISRKAILEEFENDQYHLEFYKEHHIERSISMEMVRIRLHDLPPVNPQAKTEHWKHIRCDMYVCSECQHIYTDLSGEKQGMNFCPNCGCRMIEPQESEE